MVTVRRWTDLAQSGDRVQSLVSLYRKQISSCSPTTGQKHAAFILPGPARLAWISVSSMAITRERRADSGWR